MEPVRGEFQGLGAGRLIRRHRGEGPGGYLYPRGKHHQSPVPAGKNTVLVQLLDIISRCFAMSHLSSVRNLL